MTACLTGMLQAPLTSFVIVSEMTANHVLVIPVMLASFVARAASLMVSLAGIDHLLSRHYLPESLGGDHEQLPASEWSG